VSFFGLASFLVFVGIYSSAISVAQDSKLRKSIRGFAIEETKLLDSIGTAQMEREIEKKVIGLTKINQNRMAKETGIQSSLSEDDIKRYLKQVIQEVQKHKTYPTND
jgi:Tfp pilus assembly PilM family ATPase